MQSGIANGLFVHKELLHNPADALKLIEVVVFINLIAVLPFHGPH